jgi:choice-of-anchor C domain-containing protein
MKSLIGILKASLATAVLSLAVSWSYGASIPIVNGSFENPLVNASFNTYFGPNNTISLPGWTINGSIDQIGSYWQAADGSQSLDMAGDFAGSIQQTVLIPGSGTATVQFSLAGNPDQQSMKTLQVELIGDGGPQIFLFDSTGHTRNAMGWVVETATFNIPAAGNYTLQFSDVGDPSNPYGPALDNVSMTANVPDGGMTVMLLGMGLLGLASARRIQTPAYLKVR